MLRPRARWGHPVGEAPDEIIDQLRLTFLVEPIVVTVHAAPEVVGTNTSKHSLSVVVEVQWAHTFWLHPTTDAHCQVARSHLLHDVHTSRHLGPRRVVAERIHPLPGDPSNIMLRTKEHMNSQP